MNQNRSTAPLVLVLPALLAFSSRSSELAFRPAAASALTKSFQHQSETTLEDMTIMQNGQEIDSSAFGVEMTATSKYRVTVTDVYDAAADGRPTKLTRHFDEIALSGSVSTSNAMMGEQSFEMTGKSDLEGVRVVFTWDGDAEDYDVAYPEGVNGDDDLLEGLEEDLDLLGLLPTKEVSEGDTWTIEPSALRSVFAPGGDVKIDVDVPDDEMGMGNSQPTPDKYIGDLEGEVTGSFVGTREEDGVKVAVIHVTVDVSSNKDLTELTEDMMGDAMKERGVEMDLQSMDSEFSFEGEGDLLWNLELGVLHALELSGESSQTIDTSMHISMQGQELAMEQSMTFGGNTTITVTTEKSS